MTERPKENPQNITQEAFDTANKIFESFPATDETSPVEHRTKTLSDGSGILITKARTAGIVKSSDTFVFLIRSVQGNLNDALNFELDEDGLGSLFMETNLRIGKSEIPNTSLKFDAGFPNIHSRTSFRAASKELVNWVGKCLQEDKLSNPPISIKPRIKY